MIAVTLGTKVLVGIAALGWGLLTLVYGAGTISLYQRGYGGIFSLADVFIPMAAFAASIVLPIWISRKGLKSMSSAVAWLFVLGLVPAYGFTLMLAAI